MSFRSSAQTEDFDLLARMDVRYMLGSRVNQARSRVICRHSARPEDISALPSIVLQKSKIDRLQKFRESRFLDFSSAARLRTARTKVCSRSFDKRCGPFTSLRTKRISGARKFRSSAPKDFLQQYPLGSRHRSRLPLCQLWTARRPKSCRHLRCPLFASSRSLPT